MEEELKHHPRGMSRWPAVLACGCFKGKGESADANYGTEMHGELAKVLTVFKETGALPPADSDASFHLAGVYRAAAMIRDCLYLQGVQPSNLHIEERVTLEDGVFGTADVWYGDARGCLYVWDFKTFYNPGRDYTAQLAGYALAICQQREDGGGKPYNEVCLRTVYGDNPSVSEVYYTLCELQCIHGTVMVVFDMADRGEAQPTQCNWCELCANAATCPAFKAVAETVTKPIYASIPAQWETLPIEIKAQMLVLAETVVKWADAVREKAKADLMSGAVIEDEANGIRYCLRTVSGRKTPRTADACKMLMGKGVSADDIRGELTMSATSVKKLLKSAGLKGKAIEEALASVCDVSAGSVQMVRG
jgi:hypothetical protein